MWKTFEVPLLLFDNTPELQSPKDGTCRLRMQRKEAKTIANKRS